MFFIYGLLNIVELCCVRDCFVEVYYDRVAFLHLGGRKGTVVY